MTLYRFRCPGDARFLASSMSYPVRHGRLEKDHSIRRNFQRLDCNGECPASSNGRQSSRTWTKQPENPQYGAEKNARANATGSVIETVAPTSAPRARTDESISVSTAP